MGFFESGDFGDLSKCAKDLDSVEQAVESAIKDFEDGGLSSTVAGIKELGAMVHDVENALDECEQISSDDWSKLNHAVHLFKHPVRFAFHVLKDIIHNGVQIYHDINDAIDNYHN
jgi:hypothetical protein